MCVNLPLVSTSFNSFRIHRSQHWQISLLKDATPLFFYWRRQKQRWRKCGFGSNVFCICTSMHLTLWAIAYKWHNQKICRFKMFSDEICKQFCILKCSWNVLYKFLAKITHIFNSINTKQQTDAIWKRQRILQKITWMAMQINCQMSYISRRHLSICCISYPVFASLQHAERWNSIIFALCDKMQPDSLVHLGFNQNLSCNQNSFNFWILQDLLHVVL